MCIANNKRGESMLTVRQFLEIPDFHDLKIISGSKGIDNIISSVNIMDNPDALDWFSPGELLLTSGYFFKDSIEIQNQVVRQLRSINCPALCIKPKRYLGKIPHNIIILADELNLPVIELPYGMPFSKIANIIREEISDNFDTLNKKSLEIHKVFFDISLKGGGVSKISSVLAQMISNPVIILDKFFNIINWTDVKDNSYPLNKYIHHDSSNEILNSDFFSSLPPDFEQLQKPLVRKISLDENPINIVITPVLIQNFHYGYILVFNTVKELSDIDYIAIEHSTMTFALERIRNNEIERTKNRIRRDFLDELLMGRITDYENLKYLCDIHRINVNLSYVPIVFSLNFFGNEDLDMIEKKRFEDEKVKKFLYFIDNYGNDKPYTIHGLSIHGRIIVLLGFKSDSFDSRNQNFKDICLDIVQKTEESLGGLMVHCGIGGVAKNIMGINHYFNQASESLRLINKSPSLKKVCHFDDFVVHNFLEENIDNISMRRYFENTLGELYKYDIKNEADLLNTLESWIENNLNISKTSRSLFTHRNTVLYRIERISEILNADLKDSNELLKYQLALKIYRLLDL